MKIFIFILLFSFIQFSYGKDYIRPESFGAVGNGLIDDSTSLQKALDSGKPLFLNGIYLISRSLNITSDIFGPGKIIVGNDDVSINCSTDNVKISGIVFDYQQHEGKFIRLKRASNITIENCQFLNVGNKLAKQSEGMIFISERSHHIFIRNCRFIHCLASDKSSSAGIWVNFSKPEDLCHHIYIDHCYFDDFQPAYDADAVIILGKNENVYAYVNNCVFTRCDKRALKFQARECHSKGNTIFVTRPMYCAIDFQRGYGTSVNDRIVIDYDNIAKINPNAGLLYRAICIAQGNVSVTELVVDAPNPVENIHQVAIGLQSFDDYDNGSVKFVFFHRCKFSGQSSLMTSFKSVKSVSEIILNRCVFNKKIISKIK